MSSSDDYYEYDIPHENPTLAKEAYDQRKVETVEYATKLNADAISAAGGDSSKITVHPAVDPSEMIEDLELKFASTSSPMVINNAVPTKEPDLKVFGRPKTDMAAPAYHGGESGSTQGKAIPAMVYSNKGKSMANPELIMLSVMAVILAITAFITLGAKKIV